MSLRHDHLPRLPYPNDMAFFMLSPLKTLLPGYINKLVYRARILRFIFQVSITKFDKQAAFKDYFLDTREELRN